MTILYGGKIHAEGTADELLVDSKHTIIRVPRIHNDGTIEKIERILNESEGIGIESVEQPRQNLESFFIQIVERARQAKIKTSGVKGGVTAPFLKGDEEGEVLIDKLVKHKNEDNILASEESTSSPTVEQEEEVLESLVSQIKVELRSKEESPEQIPSKDADSEVIDSLMDSPDTPDSFDHPDDNKSQEKK
jgi:hypothetical protein